MLSYIGSIHLGTERKQHLMDQLRADTRLLRMLGIMDYSLLLGIHVRTSKSGCLWLAPKR